MAFRTNKVPAIEERTVSGSSVSFNSAFALPLKACKVSFSATQAGSGDPSPSNPRAISGVSAIGLTANSTPVSVSLGEERFGGYVDLVNKKMYITTQYILLTENDAFILYTFSGKNGVRCSKLTENGDRNNGKCSHTVINGSGSDYMWLGVSDKRIYWVGILDTLGLSDVNEFYSWITNNHVEVAVEYDTPLQIIDLSDIPDLSSIIGNNTFSTDTGTLEITFADLQEKSASGSVASFNTALAMPLPSCNIAVNAWQEGTGEPSPSNVRPIHGFSEVNATRCGVNVWDEQWETGVFNTTTGRNQNSVNNIRSKNYIAIKGNVNYFVSIHMWVIFFDKNKNVITTYNPSGVERYNNSYHYTKNSIITPPPGAHYMRFYTLNNYGGTYKNDISINYPSTDTDYHAYTGNIYTIQLGQEVYGAEVDTVNGVAHVTHELITFDGTEDWGEYGSAGFQSGVYSSLKSGNRQEGMANWLITTGTVNQFGLIIGLNNKRFYATHIKENISEVIDITSWKQYLRAHPLQVVYPLATPFDIQLTPTQIETLIGNNTIFADTGDIDLTYKDLDIAKRGNFREVFKLPS